MLQNTQINHAAIGCNNLPPKITHKRQSSFGDNQKSAQKNI